MSPPRTQECKAGNGSPSSEQSLLQSCCLLFLCGVSGFAEVEAARIPPHTSSSSVALPEAAVGVGQPSPDHVPPGMWQVPAAEQGSPGQLAGLPEALWTS